MSELFRAPGMPKGEVICDFGTNGDVHHLNYFRQKKTIDAVAGVL